MLVPNPNAISAGVNDNSIYLRFNRSFGNVDIKIYNATGSLVYNSVVDTSMQRTFIIPITGSSNGTFTVVLDNSVGFAEGDFDRQSH